MHVCTVSVVVLRTEQCTFPNSLTHLFGSGGPCKSQGVPGQSNPIPWPHSPLSATLNDEAACRKQGHMSWLGPNHSNGFQ